MKRCKCGETTLVKRVMYNDYYEVSDDDLECIESTEQGIQTNMNERCLECVSCEERYSYDDIENSGDVLKHYDVGRTMNGVVMFIIESPELLNAEEFMKAHIEGTTKHIMKAKEESHLCDFQ